MIRMMFNNIVILNGDYVIQDDYLLSERKYIVFLSDPGIPGSDNADRAIQGNVAMQATQPGG